MTIPDERAIAYTDGSCIGNPGPGGWAVHAELPDGQVLELGGGELGTTNNRMELRAAIEAVRVTARAPAVTVITDSSYVRNGVTKWLSGWKARDWRTATGQPVENQTLWRELDALTDHRITWEWTRAHVGTPGNERCDAIARMFAAGIRPLTGGPGRGRPSMRTTRPAPNGTTYLSMVDGIVARHTSWSDCERQVHGVRGARYRKARGPEEEQAVLASWGVGPEALLGTQSEPRA